MNNPFDPGDADKFAAIVRRLRGVDEATITDYVTDVWARAVEAAPQIVGFDDDSDEAKAVKAILRSVILRWHDQHGAGVATGLSAGPYQVHMAPQPVRGYTLNAAEILDLQGVGQSEGGVWSFSTTPPEPTGLPQRVLNGAEGPA
ncbi:hypothetical protein [Mycobacteroides abscessus]|uniref:hypothetical protein n=1 Tax=Mycobacteroides abscessus TaxID=36809 RepID=UPI00092947C6|nr:hypothetical protein [Mycobacteroides abscessus]SII00224.1 Uncharacterised protein [Mycobacteroides abscessus subsp. abscessus]